MIEDHPLTDKALHVIANGCALQEAERLLALAEQGAGPIKFPMLVVISHHNLAEVALRDGQMDLALSHYQTPFDRLLTLASLRFAPADLR